MSIESELAKRDRLLAEKSARIRELEHMVETRSESIRNLTELLDKCHARIRELEGERSSRWYELFGTPERAAQTIANNCHRDGCIACAAMDAGCGGGDYDKLLEWLRGDTE